MLFHSLTFAVFLAATLAAHELVPRRWRRYVLLVASYVFYGSWDARYAILILASTTVDYFAAQRIDRASAPSARRRWLVVSLAANLGILGVFKYYNFFAGSLARLLSAEIPLHELLLPVGISFYTFQSMSYTIDVYRGRIGTARDFVDFALYVAFFPQLVAGPIVRAVEFLPQLASRARRELAHLRAGVERFLVGLFKKVILADNLAVLVDRVHADPASASGADLWIAAYAFAFQIYCDFSGYSDMAIGLARLFGFEFPENFRRPYMARNVSEFWRRWHITLSSWLRDYLYIPLGGSRGGRGRTVANLMLTMLLGGLWHGAAWTFVVWGALHGAFLGVHRLFRQACERLPRLGAFAAQPRLTPVFILLTFHAWVVSMVFFRAESLGVAVGMLERMASPSGAGDFGATAWGIALLCAALYAAHALQERWDLLENFDRLSWPLRVTILTVAAWLFLVFQPSETVPFLYFQF